MTNHSPTPSRVASIAVPLLLAAVAVVLVMTRSVDPNFIATLFTYAVAFTSLAFVVVYSILAPWWKSEEGRNVASFVGVIAALSCYIASVLWLGAEYVNRDLFRVGTWAAVWLAVVRLFVLMVRRQVQARRARRHPEKREVH